MHNDSDSSGNSVKVSVNTQKERQQAFRSTTITVNNESAMMASRGGVNKTPNNNSIIFLGDCEMPITKSVTRKNSGSDTSANRFGIDGKKEYSLKVAGEIKHQLATSSQQVR